MKHSLYRPKENNKIFHICFKLKLFTGFVIIVYCILFNFGVNVMSRFLEVLLVFFVLVLLFPLIVLICMAVLIESPGNPFFLQERIGKNGKPFLMIKFRKMRCFETCDGIGVTLRNDARFTRVGRWLERFKLDELPQFINVLNGDMSIVGPRPELRKFVQHYPEKWNRVLQIRPGIVGYAQTVNPIESDLYPVSCSDPETYYVECILPEKLDREIRYISNRSLILDFSIVFKVGYLCLTGMRHSLAYCLSYS